MSLIDINNGSPLLNQIYNQYRLANLTSKGHLTDKLGDVYENFILKIFENRSVAMSWGSGTTERNIVDTLLSQLGFGLNDIVSLSASDRNIPLTINNGVPKTDVHLTFNLTNERSCLIPISVKQSTVSKVSFAEYRVSDIVTALNIQDSILINLLMKHQTDASAKNFTIAEKVELQTRLAPYADSLIRWCITLNPKPTAGNICHPEYIVKFDLYHPDKAQTQRYCFKSVQVYSVDQYISLIRYNANGTLKSGGFGTGLQWTYATGSKGTKIQLKA